MKKSTKILFVQIILFFIITSLFSYLLLPNKSDLFTKKQFPTSGTSCSNYGQKQICWPYFSPNVKIAPIEKIIFLSIFLSILFFITPILLYIILRKRTEKIARRIFYTIVILMTLIIFIIGNFIAGTCSAKKFTIEYGPVAINPSEPNTPTSGGAMGSASIGAIGSGVSNYKSRFTHLCHSTFNNEFFAPRDMGGIILPFIMPIFHLPLLIISLLFLKKFRKTKLEEDNINPSTTIQNI